MAVHPDRCLSCGRALPDPPPNPYDDLPPVVPTGGLAVFGSRSARGQLRLAPPAGAQAPTCANSGCHDGTFEPDFRTVGSSWNTLVNHPVIANDAAMSLHSGAWCPGDPWPKGPFCSSA